MTGARLSVAAAARVGKTTGKANISTTCFTCFISLDSLRSGRESLSLRLNPIPNANANANVNLSLSRRRRDF